MKLYKLTDRNRATRRNMVWGPGVTNSVAPRTDLVAHLPQLCTSDVIHAYVHPLQALLYRGNHGYGGVSVQCWEAEGAVVVSDTTKVGVKSLTTVKTMPLYFKGWNDNLKGWNDNLRRVTGSLLALEALKNSPLGHPRTGSKPMKAVKAAVAKFKTTGVLPTYAEKLVLRGCVDRIKNSYTRLLAGQTVDALSWGSTTVAGTPEEQQATYDKVWPYIQSKLEAVRQRDLEARRIRDRAKRAAAKAVKQR